MCEKNSPSFAIVCLLNEPEIFTEPHGEPGKRYACDACHWETVELPAGLVAVRFHDLRHTAVSRMIAARVPLPIIAKIVGWSAGTMAKMAARYGHFGMEELRGAVETISAPKIGVGYPQFSPQLQAAGDNVCVKTLN